MRVLLESGKEFELESVCLEFFLRGNKQLHANVEMQVPGGRLGFFIFRLRGFWRLGGAIYHISLQECPLCGEEEPNSLCGALSKGEARQIQNAALAHPDIRLRATLRLRPLSF